MDHHRLKDVANFFVAGINYKKNDAAIRGQFSINNEQYDKILTLAKQEGITELFVLSTCNRSEIYGFAFCSYQLIHLLCSQTEGDFETFLKSAYIKSGADAIEHVYNVAAGLDSQILGDYEIVGQLKTAIKFSKNKGFVGAFTERLTNSVLQSSKLIKNSTKLSSGTISVSFLAIQYIRNFVADVGSKKILLLGTGKIGRNTCKNLVDYLRPQSITLINRSPEKAEKLACELGLRSAPVENLADEIANADIVLAATNSSQPLIFKEHLQHGNKLIVDLSVPSNVEKAASLLSNVTVVNVDELSKLKDDTLKAREADVPKAKAIIGELMLEFTEWYNMRKHVPLLVDLKVKLRALYTHSQYFQTYSACTKKVDLDIQRVLNETAGKIKANNDPGCQYISALNNFITAKG